MNRITRVIVADDIKKIAEIHKNIAMSVENVEVLGIAYNGEEELEMIQKLNPDLVITDNKMPKIDGLEVIEKVNKLNMEKKPEFILVTGEQNMELIKKCNELEVFRVISKLSGSDRLVYAIQEFIDNKNYIDTRNENNVISESKSIESKKGFLEKMLKSLKKEKEKI